MTPLSFDRYKPPEASGEGGRSAARTDRSVLSEDGRSSGRRYLVKCDG